MSSALLQASRLSIGYPPALIASDINWMVQEKEVVAVLGLNGAGKTTLLRTLAGLQAPVAGEVHINGNNIAQLSAQELAHRRSFVMSGRQHVVGEVKVKELFAMTQAATQTKSVISSVQQEASALMQLEKFYERKLHTLSDGEFQRVMIARSLVQQTPLILMDEPTAHLDVVHTMETFLHIRSLPELFGVGVVFSTHDIEKALQIAQRCIVLGSKGVVYQGSPDELIRQQVISDVFSSDTVHFNNQTRRFEYSRP